MKRKLLDWLACPACGEGSLPLTVRKEVVRPVTQGHWLRGEEIPGLTEGGLREILEGHLDCPACAARYPIEDGIPRMLPPGGAPGPSSGHRWTGFDADSLAFSHELEENFADLLYPLTPASFLGKLTLDAGCGFGRHAYFAARNGAEVVALDSSEDAVASAARNLEGLVRAHVIQGDLSRPPLRRHLFDRVFCLGVLHHIAAPREALRVLDELVKPGGQLSVWVYGPRQGLTHIATSALRGAASAMDAQQLLRFSQGIALGLRAFSHTPYALLRSVPVAGAAASHLPVHDHYRWPFPVVVADIYDRLRVPVTATFKGEELERWLAEAGYADISVTRRVRNTESFRATGTRR